jgi:REP element-mobilizing transposase RayT
MGKKGKGSERKNVNFILVTCRDSFAFEYEGAIYHIMNRGDRREAIFKGDSDRELFLRTLGETCSKTEWQMHAFCLMSNHFHLLVETPLPNLVAGMKWFLGTYTARFNRRHQLFGHLFSGRYKSLIVDGSGNGYLRTVGDYVHLNPVRAHLLRPEQPLKDYRWSSFPEYLNAARPPWLRVERLLGEMGIPADTPAGRQEFERAMEQRRCLEQGETFQRIRRGWCLGEDIFRKELLAVAEGRIGEHHYGAHRHESAEDKANRIVRETLASLHWSEEELPRRPKGDRNKIHLAQRLRNETTVTLKWIAQRLHMGAWTNVANRIRHLSNPTHPNQNELFSVNGKD